MPMRGSTIVECFDWSSLLNMFFRQVQKLHHCICKQLKHQSRGYLSQRMQTFQKHLQHSLEPTTFFLWKCVFLDAHFSLMPYLGPKSLLPASTGIKIQNCSITSLAFSIYPDYTFYPTKQGLILMHKTSPYLFIMLMWPLRDGALLMLTRIIIFTGNMNDSVDNSLIYRNDEEGQLMKQIQGPLKIKIAQKKKIIIAIAVVTALLLVGTCYFAFSPAAPKEVLDQNKSLKQLNTQLKAKSAQLAQRLKQAKDLNVKLVDQNTSLTSQLQQNKGLIVYLQKDIELNCNPLKQRLRFNMTSMDAFTLSVSNTNKGALGGIPQITFLNMSGDSLKQFRDNSLPSLEYLDLTDNPIKTISNNKLDKIVDLVGTTAQPLLNEFSSNYMPMIKTLNLSHNNISAFRDNTISAVQALDISDNRLKSFSNFNLGALERLNISANPITEFSMNNFTNLVEFSCLFLVGPQGPSILFNDSYFGRVKNMQLSSIRISNSPVTLDFRNNYFPSLTNLTLKSFYTSYQSLKTNRMAELVDLAFFNCDFADNIEYFAEWNSLLSLQYESCNVNKFSGNSYPKMVKLNFSQSHVETFSNNFLPLLQEFIISELYYAADLTFNNNTFSSLRALVFNVRTNSDMSWLKALRKLQYLQLGKYQIDNFNDFDMPQLQTLKLASDQVSSFKNNLFPSLKNLTISCSRLSFDATPYQDQLEGLQVKGSKITFENYSFPKLKYLNLQSQYLSTLAGNSFPVLEQLWILNVNFTLSELPALKRFFFLGSVLNFNLPHKYEGNLETLVIDNTYMNSFDNYNMPQMKELRIIRGILDSFTLNKLPKATLIQLSQNHLTNFECGGLSAVQELGLGYNQLNDKIVDTLINCKLSQLTTLDLENNQITDIEGARKRLSSAYPNAKIVL